MKSIPRVVLVFAWLACGFVGAGFYRSTLRANTPYLSTIPYQTHAMAGISWLLVLGGPVYLATAFALSGAGYTGWENPFGREFWWPK